MIKIDLHTHSNGSKDGGIQPIEYAEAIDNGICDFMAITDHNNIKVAKELSHSLGKHIIVGEEINTTDGELIGLFLTKVISPHQSPVATAKAIKAQGGLVYVPHPFENMRAGISEETLMTIADLIDIVEVYNGRALFTKHGLSAKKWAKHNKKSSAASSDAHGFEGLGATYTTVLEEPTSKNLVKLLTNAKLTTGRPPLKTLFYPKINRLNKRIRRQ